MDHADVFKPDETDSIVPKSLIDLLGEQNWEEIIPKLVLHARRKLRNRWLYGIRDGGEGSGPGGNEAKDIVQDAIHDVFVGAGVIEGTINEEDVDHIRRWSPQQDPDILPYMLGVVDSKISKLVESFENRKGRRLAQQPTPVGSEGYDPKLHNKDVPSTDPSIERLLVDAEIEKSAEEFVWGFLSYLDGDDLLQQIVECIIEGTMKPEAIAERLGVPSKDIYNAKKRLKRKLEKYREQVGKGSASRKGSKTDGKR